MPKTQAMTVVPIITFSVTHPFIGTTARLSAGASRRGVLLLTVVPIVTFDVSYPFISTTIRLPAGASRRGVLLPLMHKISSPKGKGGGSKLVDIKVEGLPVSWAGRRRFWAIYGRTSRVSLVGPIIILG